MRNEMLMMVADPRYPTVRETPFLSRFTRVILIFAFFCFLVIPLVGLAMGRVDTVEFEFREKASAPEAPKTFSEVESYPGKLDKFMGDSFLMRGPLLIAASRLRYAMGASNSERVIAGRHGWLFYADDARAARTSIPADDPRLANWLDVMEARRQWLAARGIGFIALVGPNKQSIYPEDLPRGWNVSAISGTDRLVDYLGAHHSQVAFLDPRAILRAAKSKGAVYYQYDTHWNEIGGFVVHQALAPLIRIHYPGFNPVTQGDLMWKEGGPTHNMLRLLGLADYDNQSYREPTFDPDKVIRTDTQRIAVEGGIWETYTTETGLKGPRILALRDSFMSALQPYFSQSTSMFVSYPHKGHEFPTELIEKLHPDVVIWEMVESGLLFAGDTP